MVFIETPHGQAIKWTSLLASILSDAGCFRPSLPNMHMNRSVIVTAKTEFEPFFLEDKRHDVILLEPKWKRDIFLLLL